MLFYEMLVAIGIIAVVLVAAAIDRLVAWVMMGPEEMALLRLARAATAQRRLVASAAQQEREARAAATQRRLVAAAAQQEREARAAATQRRLVAAAAEQEREARAAAAQRRLVAAAAEQEREARAATAQRRLVAYWTHALAAPLPARLATLITQLETQDVSA
jgi:hypothetical protein